MKLYLYDVKVKFSRVLIYMYVAIMPYVRCIASAYELSAVCLIIYYNSEVTALSQLGRQARFKSPFISPITCTTRLSSTSSLSDWFGESSFLLFLSSIHSDTASCNSTQIHLL